MYQLLISMVVSFYESQNLQLTKLIITPRSFMYPLKCLSRFPGTITLKSGLKNLYFPIRFRGVSFRQIVAKDFTNGSAIKKGDVLRMGPMGKIFRTLDSFNELKVCSFLSEMHQYCGNEQRIFIVMQHFLDECDYRHKKRLD
jgi:hypothetical protein